MFLTLIASSHNVDYCLISRTENSLLSVKISPEIQPNHRTLIFVYFSLHLVKQIVKTNIKETYNTEHTPSPWQLQVLTENSHTLPLK